MKVKRRINMKRDNRQTKQATQEENNFYVRRLIVESVRSKTIHNHF